MGNKFVVVEMSDDWFFNLFEEIPRNDRGENKDEVKEYSFMTNFSNKDKHIYEKAIQVTGVDMYIKDIAYCGPNGDKYLENHGALWVNKHIGDCSKFWAVFNAIKNFYRE